MTDNKRARQLESQLGINSAASVVQKISHPILSNTDIELYIKRDDRLHPIISGNKWRKLKYILLHALELKHKHIISMGGPYSNHLHALAYIGKQLNLKTSGLIRGEEVSNPTIDDLRSWGMELHFISRDEFRDLRSYEQYDDPPAQQYNGYWIGEGGNSQFALQGIAEVSSEFDQPFSDIIVPCGTATTLAGLAQSLNTNTSVLGFAALKSAGFLNENVQALIGDTRRNWKINLDYHFGGFAKTTEKLQQFIDDFYLQTQIQLEPVYSGKMMYGLFDLIAQDYFQSGSQIIAIHTGGLQGIRK